MDKNCKFCKHFKQPDDGKYWGIHGICHGEPSLVFDSMEGRIADPESLKCGALIVKEWYWCESFSLADIVYIGKPCDCLNPVEECTTCDPS